MVINTSSNPNQSPTHIGKKKPSSSSSSKPGSKKKAKSKAQASSVPNNALQTMTQAQKKKLQKELFLKMSDEEVYNLGAHAFANEQEDTFKDLDEEAKEVIRRVQAPTEIQIETATILEYIVTRSWIQLQISKPDFKGVQR